MAQVNVTVSGLTGSGKSGVYGEIVIALNAIGVRVEHANPKAWASEKGMTHGDWLGALEMYKPTVIMAEVNVPRIAPKQPFWRRWLS